MVVVVIIGITAALAGPAVARSVAISRADRANHDMIRLVRFARSQAIAYGRAYLSRFVTTGNGRAELWEGTTSACRLENWTNITATGGCSSATAGAGPTNCSDFVDSADYDYGYHHVTFASVRGVDLCFQSSGDALTRPSGGAGAFGAPLNGVVTITTTRFEGGVTPDPQRGVVIPAGGAPRTLR